MVAGTNYKLLLDIANSQNKKESLEAVVYGKHCNSMYAGATKEDACMHAIVKAMHELPTLTPHKSKTSTDSLKVALPAEPLGGQEMKLTSHRTPSADEVRIAPSSARIHLSRPHISHKTMSYSVAALCKLGHAGSMNCSNSLLARASFTGSRAFC